MKKLFTTAVLAGAVVFGANAQRTVDVSIAAVWAEEMTINCTDSFDFGYAFVNNGPDAIEPTDTLYFIDHNSDSGYVFLAYDITAAAGDTVISWWWKDHYENVVRLTDADYNYIYNNPFPDGNYGSPIVFAGFNLPETDIVDPNDTNNAYVIDFTIDCGLGINENAFTKSIQLYPNPAQNVINFEYNFDKASNAVAKVIDVTGRTVLTKDFGMQSSGQQYFSIPVGSLLNGNYTLELVTEHQRGVSRFTVSK